MQPAAVCVCVSKETKTVATGRLLLTIEIAGAVCIYIYMHLCIIIVSINQPKTGDGALHRRFVAVDTRLNDLPLGKNTRPRRGACTLRPAREYMCALHRENRSARGGAAPLSRSRPSYATRTRAYYIIYTHYRYTHA